MVFEIGIAEVQLRNLIFNHSRDKIPAAVEHLAAGFQEHCDPAAVQNQIPVYVRPDELQQILEQSDVTMGDVQRRRLPYPRLDPSSKVQALHGRQRYEAALQCFGPQTWWAIRIYCIAEGSNPENLLHDEINEFSQQTPYSNGEVFRQVHAHERAGQWKRANMWRRRLSKNKQDRLRRLLESGPICERLYELTEYPGLRDGLELGNIHKVLAEHCVEEVCTHLDHIRDTWEEITLHNPEVQRATDVVTVQALERLAPSCCYNDQESVKKLIGSGIIFSAISSPDLRLEIQQRLLNTSVVIPSIKTFHENMSYLKVGMRILREQLLGRPRLAAGKTVAELMRSIWRPGASQIEYAEDQFYHSSSPPDFFLAYHIIFISALRNFPQLSTYRPNVEQGQEIMSAGIDDQCLRRFLRHARALGFTSRTIECKLSELSATMTLPSIGPGYPCNTQEPNVKKRSGRPYIGAYNVISRHLFLPEMLKETEIGPYPSIIYIQRDFMRSFFRGFPDHLAVIARNVGAETTHLRRSITPRHDAPQPATDSSPANMSVPAADLPQRQTSPTLTTQSPDTDFQLSAPALTAALRAQGRRQLRRHDSESMRSILSPPQPEEQLNGDYLSVSSRPGTIINLQPSATREMTHSRDTLRSIRSQDTQSSDSTGRTIIAPYDLQRYRF